MDERILSAVRSTEILRPPRQHLSTFGTTNVYYYLLTEPAYRDVVKGPAETVIREGRVIAQKPKIVTPYYLFHLEGFSPDARKYFEDLMHEQGPNTPGIFYAYRNEPKQLNIVSEDLRSVVDKLNQEVDRNNDPLTAIIKGADELWDVSILKFIFEMTRHSVADNVRQMSARGLLQTDAGGVPAEVRMAIDELFRQVARGQREPRELKEELDRWGLFGEYQDRFFTMFQRR